MTVSPTQEKVLKTINCWTELLRPLPLSIQQVSQVLGTLISNFPGVEYGPLHYRCLEVDKIQALRANHGNFNAYIAKTFC